MKGGIFEINMKQDYSYQVKCKFPFSPFCEFSILSFYLSESSDCVPKWIPKIKISSLNSFHQGFHIFSAFLITVFLESFVHAFLVLHSHFMLSPLQSCTCPHHYIDSVCRKSQVARPFSESHVAFLSPCPGPFSTLHSLTFIVLEMLF